MSAEELRTLAEAATPGVDPWCVVCNPEGHSEYPPCLKHSELLTEDEREQIENAWIVAPKGGPSGDDDPMYVAVERIVKTRIGALLAERDALRAQVERVRALADEIEKLANLAAEHIACSGCPTPWWLTNWLMVTTADRDALDGPQ